MAILLSGTTVDGNAVIHTGNISSQGILTFGATQAHGVWTAATKFESSGDIATTSSGGHSLQVYAALNNDAFMAFHISNDYAVFFGLENATNRLHTGGWSAGAAKYQIWDSRDFSSNSITKWDTAYTHSQEDHAPSGATVNSTDAVLLARANHTGTQTYSTLSGTVPTWNQDTTGNAATASNATTSRYVSSPDGTRNPSTFTLPTTNPRAVRFDFSTSGHVGTGGHYAGVMTYTPWDGTTASSGGASYQLAFGSSLGYTSANFGVPQLRIRLGADSAWYGTWYDIVTSANIGTQSVSYATTAGSLTSMNISQFTNNSGYLTAETDSQTLEWSAAETKLTISGGNDVVIDGFLTDSDISGYGFVTGGPYLATTGKAADSGLLDGYDYTQFTGVLARYGTTLGSGARIRITAPFNTNSLKMFSVDITIYAGYTQYRYTVSAYMYSTANNWHEPKALFSGDGSPDIYVGRDASGKAYISIANGNYTGVVVNNFVGGYYSTTADSFTPWVITLNNGTENSVSVSVIKQWNSSNDGSGSGLDADLLDGQQGSYYATAGDYLPLAGGVISGKIRRSSAITGFLEGSYNNVGANSSNTNPIYTIGSSYNPASTTLSNMYGIGYTHAGDASFVSLTGVTSWGLYVASDGDARVFLDGGSGNISGTGTVYASGGNSTNWNTAYDHSQVAHAPSGATANSTDAVLLARANHTGTQAYSTLSGTVPTWNQNTTGNAATATNSSQLNGLSKVQLWNNSGQGHSTYQTFGAIPDFGEWFMQKSTAADSPQSGSQFYVKTQGLGNDYAYGSYALMTAVGRDHAVKYTYYRTREGGTWQAWTKGAAGYADTAGSLTSMNISQFTNNSGYLTAATDSQELTWETTEKKLTISGGNDVVIDGFLTDSDIGGYGFLTSVAYSGLTGTVPTWNQNTTGTAAGNVATNGSTWTPHVSTVREAGWNSFYTDNGYISLGPANGSWAHIYSDKNFYFNQELYVSGSKVMHAGNIGAQSVSYADTAGSAPNGTNSNTAYNVFSGNGNGIKFWASNSYKISMGASALYYYGPVTDYSIKTQMDDGSPNRGFTWGRLSYAPIAALNATSGNMQIAGTFEASGTITAGGDITAYSDKRLKTNIKTIENALDKTLKMRGVSYNRTDSDDKSDKVGVIAQEVLNVLPEVVKEGPDGMLSVSYGNIVGVLIEAIKEQQKQIDELKSRLNNL